MNKAAMDERSPIPQRVRFEEVTPANEPAAFLTADLISLVAPLKLPIYDGYDDLDDLRFAFLTLPSGQTVMLGEYLNSPQPGTDLYVDARMQHSPQIVFEAFQYLNISRSVVAWFHPDFQEEIDRLYTNNSHNFSLQTPLQTEESRQAKRSQPIDCFHYALQIYDRDKFPQYWAMLQRNLGLAYYHRIEGDRQENLERSIVCFHNALEIHTLREFSNDWEIDNRGLAAARRSLDQLNTDRQSNLVKDILVRPIKGRNLQGPNLIYATIISGGGDVSKELAFHPRRFPEKIVPFDSAQGKTSNESSWLSGVEASGKLFPRNGPNTLLPRMSIGEVYRPCLIINERSIFCVTFDFKPDGPIVLYSFYTKFRSVSDFQASLGLLSLGATYH
jgi:hypothetical protein